jgi:RING finger family protein
MKFTRIVWMTLVVTSFNCPMNRSNTLELMKKSDDSIVCAICRDEEDDLQKLDPKTIARLKCAEQHQFHKSCLDAWKKVKNACPYCQKPIVTTWDEAHPKAFLGGLFCMCGTSSLLAIETLRRHLPLAVTTSADAGMIVFWEIGSAALCCIGANLLWESRCK